MCEMFPLMKNRVDGDFLKFVRCLSKLVFMVCSCDHDSEKLGLAANNVAMLLKKLMGLENCILNIHYLTRYE